MQILTGLRTIQTFGSLRSKTTDELESSKIRDALESPNPSKQSSPDLVKSAQEGTLSKDVLALSSINNLVSITEQALSEIKNLRERQEELTELVSESPETYTGTIQSERDEELDTIQTEITRIVSAASYNNIQNLLQSPTTVSATLVSFSEGRLAGGTTQQVLTAGIGSSTSITQSLGADASSVSQASTSNTTLEGLVAGARVFADGVATEQAITEASLRNKPTDKLKSGERYNKLSNIKEAEQVADRVADEISNLPDEVKSGRFMSAAENLISFSSVGLDPYRVKNLLEE